MQKPNPYLLPRSEVYGHRAFRRAGSFQPPPNPFQTLSKPAFPLIFLMFCYVLLISCRNRAYPAYVLPSLMLQMPTLVLQMPIWVLQMQILVLHMPILVLQMLILMLQVPI